MNLEDSQAGFMMSTISFFYLFGCVLLPYTCAKSPRKFQFFMSFIGFTVCMVLMGPSKFLKLPRELTVMFPAYPLLGICQVFVFIPIIPEMIERLQVSLEISDG
jgi:hypothetical protein